MGRKTWFASVMAAVSDGPFVRGRRLTVSSTMKLSTFLSKPILAFGFAAAIYLIRAVPRGAVIISQLSNGSLSGKDGRGASFSLCRSS